MKLIASDQINKALGTIVEQAKNLQVLCESLKEKLSPYYQGDHHKTGTFKFRMINQTSGSLHRTFPHKDIQDTLLNNGVGTLKILIGLKMEGGLVDADFLNYVFEDLTGQLHQASEKGQTAMQRFAILREQIEKDMGEEQRAVPETVKEAVRENLKEFDKGLKEIDKAARELKRLHEKQPGTGNTKNR